MWYKAISIDFYKDAVPVRGELYNTEGSALVCVTGVVEHSAVTLIGLDLMEGDRGAGHSELPSLTLEAHESGVVVPPGVWLMGRDWLASLRFIIRSVCLGSFSAAGNFL